jgi:uncharacterized protein YeaO (DUF488 family)
VSRNRWEREGYFDVWLPVVAPSADLLRRFHAGEFETPAGHRRYLAAYEREMSRAEPRQAIELLARLAGRTPIAIGCFCKDESDCHRSKLKALIEEAARR